MIPTLSIDLQTERRVTLRFDEMPRQVHAALLGVLTQDTPELAARIRAAEPHRTGSLAAHTLSKVVDGKDFVLGMVYLTSQYAKAAALEYGAHKTTKVRAHEMRLDHFMRTLLDEPMTVLVAEYHRTPNIAAHAFERGTLAEMGPEILEHMRLAVGQVVAQG